jgi:molybdenum cofactor cytidylyltransferase
MTVEFVMTNLASKRKFLLLCRLGMAGCSEVGMEAKNNSRIGAVILAAGTSSRMGEAKQLLRLGEHTLLGQVVENVRGSRVDEIVLVLGHAAETIKERIVIQSLKIVINEAYRQGMGTSLRAGLSALHAGVDAALIVLADQPFVRSATLDLLIDQYQQCNAQIVIPIYKGFRGNPVLLDRSVFSEVMALSGDIGCRAIFGNHLEGIVKVPVEDVGILLDLDSKDDFERLQHFGQGTADERALIEAANLEGREISGAGDLPRGQELILVGREPVAIALAKLGKLLHFTVTVVDPLLNISDVPEADRLLNSLDFSHLPPASARYVVVASRGKFDEEAVEQALHANSAYVALVANKRRAQEIHRSLELRGEPPEKLAKVRAPAGLDIGAETPEEIALSIMAEIVSESRNRGGNRSAASS